MIVLIEDESYDRLRIFLYGIFLNNIETHLQC